MTIRVGGGSKAYDEGWDRVFGPGAARAENTTGIKQRSSRSGCETPSERPGPQDSTLHPFHRAVLTDFVEHQRQVEDDGA